MSPFTPVPEASVAHLGERALIDTIKTWLGSVNPPSPQGMGDDCAVLPTPEGKTLLTVDPLIYGRHFDDTLEPELAGAKLLKRNLSDIAAMGGSPQAAILALCLSGDVATAWLEHFIDGLKQACIDFSMTINGGDIAQAPSQHFAATLTLFGNALRPMTRLGGVAGDTLWVTGELGGSILGHHACFTPRLAEGQWLAAQAEVKAMMDMTDGLAKDLPAMLAPQTCAQLDTASLPLAQAASLRAKETGHTPLYHACCDGEDYELLFVLDAQADIETFQQAWQNAQTTRLSCIGRIDTALKPEHALRLIDSSNGEVLFPQGGYEHLSNHDG
ncbi:MAG: thiamine-phosphate kinase [Verrucomicrobiota bacterium]